MCINYYINLKVHLLIVLDLIYIKWKSCANALMPSFNIYLLVLHADKASFSVLYVYKWCPSDRMDFISLLICSFSKTDLSYSSVVSNFRTELFIPFPTFLEDWTTSSQLVDVCLLTSNLLPSSSKSNIAISLLYSLENQYFYLRHQH